MDDIDVVVKVREKVVVEIKLELDRGIDADIFLTSGKSEDRR